MNYQAPFLACLLLLVGAARAQTLYVSSGTQTINKITADGAVSIYATLPANAYPRGLTFDAAGNLYTVNAGLNTISKVTPAGVVSQFASLPDFSNSIGLVIDSSGNLYTTSGTNGTNSILKISPAGVVTVFASPPGSTLLASLVFDGSGNLYASAANSRTIYKITPAAAVTVFATLPNPASPEGLAFDSGGNLFTVSDNTTELTKITPAGVTSVFATSGGSVPYGLVRAASGFFFVANHGSDTIVKISADGATKSTFASGISLPNYIAIFESVPVEQGDLITTFDTGLEGWTATGGLLAFTASGGNPGGFLSLRDNAADAMKVDAPARFSGNLSRFLGGTLSFDAKNLNSAPADLAAAPFFGTVTITGADATATLLVGGESQPAADALWHRSRAALDPVLWSGDLARALANVTKISVTLESSGNAAGERNGFDNFRLAPGKPAELIAIALTGDTAAGVPAEAHYNSFGLPVVSSGGELAFRASVLSGQTSLQGIWASPTRQPALLAAALVGQPAGGFFAGETYSRLSDPQLNASGDLFFSGTIAGSGVTASNDTALWSGPPEEVGLLVQEGTAVPGGTSSFSIFGAAVPLEFQAGAFVVQYADGRSAIYKGGDELTLVAEDGQAAPGAAYNFASLRNVRLSPDDTGNFAFLTLSPVTEPWLADEEALARLAAVGDSVPLAPAPSRLAAAAAVPPGTFANFASLAMGSDGTTFFAADYGSGKGVFRNRDGVTNRLLKQDDLAAANPGVSISSYDEVYALGSEAVLVKATLAAGGGKCLIVASSDGVRLVARQGSAAPGTNFTFGDLGGAIVASALDGSYSFLAPLAGNGISTANAQSLWQATGAGTPKLLLQAGSEVEVSSTDIRTVKTIDMAGTTAALDYRTARNGAGETVVRLGFLNGTSGIFLFRSNDPFQLPPQPDLLYRGHGDDIYTLGAQSYSVRLHRPTARSTYSYHLRLQNDGKQASRFTIKLSLSRAAFKYALYRNGRAQARNYKTPTLAPGEALDLVLKVKKVNVRRFKRSVDLRVLVTTPGFVGISDAARLHFTTR